MTLGCHTEGKRRKRIFTITYLTDKEYHQLDKFLEEKVMIPLRINRGNQTFFLSANNIECYGDIDYSPGSKDLRELEYFDWFDEVVPGYSIPANYDYATHTCKSPIKRVKTFDTINIKLIMPYIHGLLNKPKYTVVFREDKKCR